MCVRLCLLYRLNPTMYTVFARKPTRAEGPMRIAIALAALLLTQLAKAQDREPCITGLNILITQPNPQSKIPFTATVKETFDQKLADGNAIHGIIHYRIARDASGRSMTEMPSVCFTGEDGHRHQGYQVTVFDQTTYTNESWQVTGGNQSKIATIFHFPPPQIPSPAELAAMRANAQNRPPTVSQVQTERLGTREFQGFAATGTRRTQTTPAGEEGNALPLVTVNESWISRDLSLTMMAIGDDPRRGRTTAEIEELHRGDPDPALFSPPEGYTIKEQNVQTQTIVAAPTQQ